MKKSLLLAILLMGVVFSTYAQFDNQATPKLGIGFSIGVATGPNATAYPAAGGLHARFEYPLSDDGQLSAVLKAGYTFFVSKDGYSYQSDGEGDTYTNGSILSFVPIEIGAKYYVAGKLFVEGEVGASFSLSSNATYTDDEGNTFSKSISKISPIISPNVGYTVPFGQTRGSVDLSLGYDASPQSGGGYNQVVFKATFNFGL